MQVRFWRIKKRESPFSTYPPLKTDISPETWYLVSDDLLKLDRNMIPFLRSDENSFKKWSLSIQFQLQDWPCETQFLIHSNVTQMSPAIGPWFFGWNAKKPIKHFLVLKCLSFPKISANLSAVRISPESNGLNGTIMGIEGVSTWRIIQWPVSS